MQFKDFTKEHIPIYGVSVLLAIGSVFFGLAPYYLVYRLLLDIVQGCSERTVLQYALLILLALSLQILMHCLSTAISHKMAFSILKKIRLAVTEKMMRMPLGYTQAKGSGYFHSLLIDSIERLEYPLAHAIPETTSNVLLPVSIIALLFSFDWRMGLSLLAPAGLTLLFYLPMYIGIMNEFAATYYTMLETMNGRVIEYIRGNKEIKIFGREDAALSKYDTSIDEYKTATLHLYNRMYMAASPSIIVLSSLLASVLSVGGFLYCAGSLSAHLYLFSVLVSVGIGTSLLKFTEFMDNFYHIKNGERLINEVLSAPELQEPDTPTRSIPSNEIALQHVSFAYEDVQVLHDISLVFPEKTKTAIVGPSGSGKTTVANLIARFWDVREGSLRIGGVAYRDISLDELMRRVSYVTQDTFLFNMTIMENIRLGKPDASDEEVIEAAKKAYCHEFICALENGYDTMAGDDGAKLSGGQRQRIIIARAMLRNAPVLILDESTAYADMENQHKIQKSLEQLCKDKTLIVIAHRLSTVTGCDQIIVMNNGTVAATGTHSELLEQSPLYAKLWDTHEQSRNWKLERGEQVRLQ
ncbi:ABC transporter ATP-binding protein [Treponema vincentii]|uniref:ABC transporter ATP-binding protein n=1 Tax=Treponema vincentii TaxID=69710 RepID=UPI0020A28C23|nr:ABC transporter ATP-binding protein [Treponema vincentii]UTC49292.1 ABC transporter ATP-binding protein [Treponema vincentii]